MYASSRQATLYSRLDTPHYSESAIKMKSEIAEFLQAHPGHDCLSTLYRLPDQNSITPFLLVLNCLLSSVDTIFTEIDWECIAKMPYSEVEQATQEATLLTPGQQRQFLFADYSNTSGLNQSRADDPSGMPRPAILNRAPLTIPNFLFKSQKSPFYLPLILTSPLSLFTSILITLSVTMSSKKSSILTMVLRPFKGL
jgi:hypothetical protein